MKQGEREALLKFLQNQTGAAEEACSHAEDLLVAWLETFDTELAEAWVRGSEGWRYE